MNGPGRLASACMQVIALADREQLARYSADVLTTSLPRHRGLGLAGGTTPEATYRLLSQAPISWERLTLWMTDERWVPSDHSDRNSRMARDTLGETAAGRLEAPLFGELMEPDRAAQDYERVLRRSLPDGPGLVLLGMGDDGHTASLFPTTSALAAKNRTYVANEVPGRGWRLTATIDYLSQADRLVFLIAGETKAAVLARILDAGGDFPARTVMDSGPPVTVILDEAAASQLSATPVNRP